MTTSTPSSRCLAAVASASRHLISLIALVALGGCGGGSSNSPPPPASHTVGGTVTGLRGTGLVLKNNGADALSVTGSQFTFATAVAGGGVFAVTASTQPSNPTQTCAVDHGTGTISGSDVTNVAVTCTTNSYTLGGTVNGLTGSGLSIGVLMNGSSVETVSINESGNFSFANPLSSGAQYQIVIDSNPVSPLQGCGVANSMGTVAGANVSVTVTCNAATEELVFTDSAVAVVNPIDPSTGVAAPLAAGPVTVDSSLVSIRTDPAGKTLYASSRSAPGIKAFNFDAGTGQLTQLSGSPYVIAQGIPFSLVFDGTGKFLYAALSSAGAAGFTRNSDGTLAPIAGSPFAWPPVSFNSIMEPVTQIVAASSKFIYYQQPLQGVTQIQVNGFQINPTTGALTALGTAPMGASGLGAIDPAGKSLYYMAYSGSEAASTVHQFSIDATSGALTPGSLPANQSTMGGIVMSPSGNFLYATNGTGVWAYSVDATTGALTAVAGSPFATGSTSAQLGTLVRDPAGKFLYVGIRLLNNTSQLAAFAVDATTGVLTLAAGSPQPIATEIRGMAVITQ